jgi:hypothetical protein
VKARGHEGHTYEDRVLSPDYDPNSEPELDEVVRCPYCGNWTELGQVEAPSDHCHHDVLEGVK